MSPPGPACTRQSVRGLNCRLFGIFPVKDITVMLVEPETVYASGMPVGIYAKTKGVLVIGNGNIEFYRCQSNYIVIVN